MNIEDYNYDLPKELIAQTPLKNRSDSRLLVMDKNTGKYAGRNVVELFVAAPKSKSLNKPIKELRDYAKTRLLQPGESETMTMNINTDDLASFNEKASAWKTDAGTYQFLICSSAQDVEARCLATVKSSVRKVNNVMKPLVKLHLLHR